MLGLVVACMGEATGPDATNSSIPNMQTAFWVVPSAVTAEINQSIRFRGESETRQGKRYKSPVRWEASGGSITAEGTFTAGTAGTYKIVGRGRGRQKPDTSIVVVVPPPPNLTGVEISPQNATLSAGATHTFTAVGRLSVSSTAPIGVTWSATGGTIDPSGVYTAGSTAGSYRVIATNIAGTLADTASVAITVAETPPPSDPQPDPDPQPEPDPTPPPPLLASVILKPGLITLAKGSSKQFAAFGRNSLGDSVAIAVSYSAAAAPSPVAVSTPPAGLREPSGSWRPPSGLADTSVVTVAATLSSGGSGGIPYGVFSTWEGST